MPQHEGPALSPNERRPSLTNIEQSEPRPRLPRLHIDPDAIAARYNALLAARDTSEFRARLVATATDVPPLLSEVDRLWLLLVAARRRYANLLAAARATLAADYDGEPDPLSYLRDELPASHGGRR